MFNLFFTNHESFKVCTKFYSFDTASTSGVSLYLDA